MANLDKQLYDCEILSDNFKTESSRSEQYGKMEWMMICFMLSEINSLRDKLTEKERTIFELQKEILNTNIANSLLERENSFKKKLQEWSKKILIDRTRCKQKIEI